MESGTHRNVSSNYTHAARGSALPQRKHNLESLLIALCKCWLDVWYTCSYSHLWWKDCVWPGSFPRRMNTSMEQLPHEERANGTRKQSEISKRMILWRRWIKSKYWASILIRWGLRATWRNHCAAGSDQAKARYYPLTNCIVECITTGFCRAPSWVQRRDLKFAVPKWLRHKFMGDAIGSIVSSSTTASP